MKEFVAQQLQKEKTNSRCDPGNAGTDIDAGRVAALTDFSSLLDLYGEEAAIHAPEVARAKISGKNPVYNPITERNNGDTFWVSSYASTMEMFGVTGLDTSAFKQPKKQNSVSLNDVHYDLIRVAAALKSYQMNLSLDKSSQPPA